jgi:conjugal transfer pilus assembly protein TraK
MSLFLLPPLWAVAAPTPEDLPGIPLKTIRQIEEMPMEEVTLTPKFSKEPGAPTPAPASMQMAKPKAQTKNDPPEETSIALALRPGENAIIPVAQGHPNRLVTPFEHPKVHTSSDAQIDVDQSVVYVTPSERNLVTMFITEMDGSQEQALSMTLVPRSIPPREVRLLVDGFARGAGYISAKAEVWEKSQEYTNVISQTMGEVARRITPQGYGLRHPAKNDPQINCQMKGVRLEPGQAMDGHNMIIVIAKAINEGGAVTEIQESSCYDQNVLAVAAWPRVRLDPGQSTELYVMFRRPQPEEMIYTRPSLIGE